MDHNEFFSTFGDDVIIKFKISKKGHHEVNAEELYQQIKARLIDDLRINVKTASSLARLQDVSR